MGEDTKRAWRLHFARLAGEYAEASRRAMGLARRAKSKATRRHMVREARGCAKAARIARNAAAGVWLAPLAGELPRAA